jgi:hypothetical protein
MIPTVPQFTEGRIKQLCSAAIAIKTEEDVDRVMEQLREALEEHIRLAKKSLTIQAGIIFVLDSATKKPLAQAEFSVPSLQHSLPSTETI